jgi:hypothetical protein
MKKLVFATMMCIAAMSAKAQVLTSETVKHVYEEVSHKADSKFAFNADFTGQDITTMYVYRMNGGGRDMLTLKPHMKYDYTYAADGTLTSKITYHWDDCMNSWKSTARYDYTLADGEYYVEYSRYNPTAKCFDQPVDKMVYSLMPYDNYVSSYHRNDTSIEYQLISELQVLDTPVLLAEK